jgi:hypothetical protein
MRSRRRNWKGRLSKQEASLPSPSQLRPRLRPGLGWMVKLKNPRGAPIGLSCLRQGEGNRIGGNLLQSLNISYHMKTRELLGLEPGEFPVRGFS